MSCFINEKPQSDSKRKTNQFRFNSVKKYPK